MFTVGVFGKDVTANTMAKMANGVADNLLLTSYLSARCSVMFAPAMDLDMFQHPSTQKNISTLVRFGNIIIEPTTGELASGLEGKGRMAEPETIVDAIKNFFLSKNLLSGKKILITAGPTYEAIDPVRFIGNHSSGKMGYAIADTLANMGAEVTLVSGPVQIKAQSAKIKLIKITSAIEMHAACLNEFPLCNAAVMCAAVADYTPINAANEKIKRFGNNLILELKQNPDIAADLGKLKTSKQILVGFALETNNMLENAQQKLIKKNLDFIILNSLNEKGAGFNSDTNKISIIEANNKIENFELKSKTEVAKDIANKMVAYLNI